jgi:cell division protein FtsI (penicillin-binding protein 3)
MTIKQDIFWRIAVSFFFLVVIGIAIVWKIFTIQFVQGKQWRSMADSLTIKSLPVPAERGNIYSADGHLLATSLPYFDVRMDMHADGLTDEIFNAHIDSLSQQLSALFKDNSASFYKSDLARARARGERFHLVHADVTYPDYLKLKTFSLFNLGQNRGGLIAIQEDKRFYPYHSLAVRTLGYIRDTSVKPIGLEGTFDNSLTGIPGKQLMQKVSGGFWMPVSEKHDIEPQNGKDIMTTLNINAQDVAENALLKTLTKNKADHGCCVVMDVKTGAIVAMANLGVNTDGSYSEKFNYAVGEAHEPGSTFKVASMIAMLEDHYINIHDTVDVELGVHKYFNQTMKDAEKHGLRRVSIEKAFAISSNVGISKLVFKYYYNQPEKYLQHLRDLHLNKPTGIELPGEAHPYIKNTQDPTWSRVSLPWMAVGYEEKITPLQLLTLYNAVADTGKMMEPYLVSSIDQNGKVIQQFQPTVLNPKICSNTTLANLKELLEDVIREGTAENIKTNEYTIAGKTGTAQLADDNRGYANPYYQSSFCGFFPADSPKYSCIVVVDKPTAGVYYGAVVAAPVFREVADYLFATTINKSANANYQFVNDSANKKSKNAIAENFSIKNAGYKYDLVNLYHQLGINNTAATNADWVHTTVQKDAAAFTDAPSLVENEVPDVTGMGLSDALYLLENAGLEVRISGRGYVKSQSLKAGEKISKGQIIQLQLGT